MKRTISDLVPQIIAGVVSLLLSVLSGAIIELQIEGPISETGLSNLTIPISIAFGLLANIVIILNFDLLKRLPGIEKVIYTVERQSNVSVKLFESLKEEEVELQKIYSHLYGKNLYLKEFGNSLIKNYLEGFSLDKTGISLFGEHWALQTYVSFWQYLSQLQEERSRGKDRRQIIARITHSNDINIWRTSVKNYRTYAEDAYLFQKKFIDNGGIIVRVLIGKEDTPGKEYQEVMKIMQGIGIEVKYVSQSEVSERDFDFMYLADEEIVMKWYSGNNGQRLAKCSIVDEIEDVVIRNWANLFELLKRKGDPIISIPPDREYEL